RTAQAPHSTSAAQSHSSCRRRIPRRIRRRHEADTPRRISRIVRTGLFGLAVEADLAGVLDVIDGLPKAVSDCAFGLLVLPRIDADTFRVPQQITVDVTRDLRTIRGQRTVLGAPDPLRPPSAVDVAEVVRFADHSGRIVLVVTPFLRPAGDFVQPRELHVAPA